MMKNRRHSRVGGTPVVDGVAPWSVHGHLPVILLDSRLRENDGSVCLGGLFFHVRYAPLIITPKNHGDLSKNQSVAMCF